MEKKEVVYMKILDIPKWKYFHIFMYLIVHKKKIM